MLRSPPHSRIESPPPFARSNSHAAKHLKVEVIVVQARCRAVASVFDLRLHLTWPHGRAAERAQGMPLPAPPPCATRLHRWHLSGWFASFRLEVRIRHVHGRQPVPRCTRVRHSFGNRGAFPVLLAGEEEEEMSERKVSRRSWPLAQMPCRLEIPNSRRYLATVRADSEYIR